MMLRGGAFRLPFAQCVALRSLSSSIATVDTDGHQVARRRKDTVVNNAITLALAPEGTAKVTLPDSYAEDLEHLYQAFMTPLEQPPQRSDRIAKHRAMDTSLEAFFALTERSADSYAALVRCCGHQDQLERAHEAVEDMVNWDIKPNGNTFCALIEACGRAADVPGVEKALTNAEALGIELSAPMFTGLIQAHRNAGTPPVEIREVLGRMRKAKVLEDAPTHTALILAFVEANDPVEAWDVWDEMITAGVTPDGVTFNVMMQVCEKGDQFEQVA